MFDIGFSELLVIGLVALIVIGPERLPRVARTIGHLVGRLQRYVADVKADISREVELEELRKMRETVQEAATGIESSVQGELDKTASELNRAAESAVTDQPAAPAPAAGAPVAGTPAAATPAKAGATEKSA
ncbi:MAG: Sec-independent protein translocase protein TatB [Burkholderiales bacterium]